MAQNNKLPVKKEAFVKITEIKIGKKRSMILINELNGKWER